MTNPSPTDPSGPTAPGEQSTGSGEQLLDAGAVGADDALPADQPDSTTDPLAQSEGRTGESGQGLAN